MGSMTQEAQALAVTRIGCMLADRIPDPAIFCDPSGVVLLANAAFEDRIGVSRREILGKPLSWTGIVEAGVAASWIERSSARTDGGWSESVEIRTPSGSCVETVCVTPLRWGEAAEHAFCVLLESNGSRECRPAYRISDACRAVTRYASKAAHDLRNPLTGISTGVQYLRRSLEDHPRQTEALTAILAEIQNLDDQIERLAGVGRMAADIRPGTYNPGAAITESLQRSREEWEPAGLRPQVWIDPLLREAPGDGEQITRALTMIFQRVAGIASQGSALRVRATLRPAPPLHGHGDPSGEWALVVLDCRTTGSDARESLELLDPSSPGWESQRNLYVAAGIIEAHCGHIDLSGHPGRSIRVSVMLPV